jgi:soluble lytic murein transglycosylase-like protein
MQICFHRRSRSAALTVLAAGLSAIGLQAEPAAAERPTTIYKSVVRTDRQGHLVRSVVVQPKAIAPRAIAPLEVSKAEVASSGAVLDAPSVSTKIEELIEKAAARHEVDPLLVHSVISVESAYNTKAVSPKGAQGLMQLIPATARRFGAADAFDPAQNIDAGVRYLKYLNMLFPNDLRLALAAYNAGEGAVWKYGNAVPPYRETEQYVYKVGQRYGKARKAAAARKPAAAEPVASAKPAEPRYLPVRSFVDAEGRLHLQTVPEAQATP